MRKFTNYLAALTTVVLFSTGIVTPSEASDHLDAPLVQMDSRIDINDLYVFQSPNNPKNSVLIMTVNPLAGVMNPTTFNDDADYLFEIDNNGDAISDVSFKIEFLGNNRQSVRVQRIVGGSTRSISNGPVGRKLQVRGGGMFQAGVYDDPFFFDLNGFQNNFNFTGDDFFAGLNVSAIVLEVPSESLGGSQIAVWARTVVGTAQIDRVGRPAINTVLIPSARKDEFNFADPVNDFGDFGDDVQAAITGLSGDKKYAAGLTAVLLPDVLTIDTSSSDGFLNGRQLADDVIDAELGLLTQGGVSTDLVDSNDVPFNPLFPYLGTRQ